MGITVKEFKVPSSDGVHTLWGQIYLPGGEARGYLHVVHGMTEHIRRYEPLMRHFAELGYLVFGYDHLGHGYTAKDMNELGYIAERDGWQRLADDVGVFAAAVRTAYPLGAGKPYYLMGHSMGSFIVRVAVARGLRPDKLIVMGTGGPHPASGVGLALIKTVKAFRGGKTYSPFVDRLTFGSYNKRFSADGDPRAWLTRDAAHRAKYAADPYCTFHFSLSAMQDLVTLNRRANSGEWFRSMPKALPILLVSGSDDPVGSYGRGVTKVYEKLRKTGHENVRLTLYPGGRHEILNDACAGEVVSDITSFLDA